MKETLIKPKELIVYECLTGRMAFTKEQKKKKQNLLKGFQGERLFSKLLEKSAQGNYIALYDLLFEYQGSIIQIDGLLIFRHKIVLLEIKNYYGEFILQDDYLIANNTGKQYRNPLHQLQRSDLQLREILSSFNMMTPLTSHIVFVHPQFTLFHAKPNPMIILPTQLEAFIIHLNKQSNRKEKPAYDVADVLWRAQRKGTVYHKLLDYHDDRLAAGVLCKRCRTPMEKDRAGVSCTPCKIHETTVAAVMRNIDEFRVLFPNKKITTAHIFNWCGGIFSRSTIKRILANNYQLINKNKHSYYIEKEESCGSKKQQFNEN